MTTPQVEAPPTPSSPIDPGPLGVIKDIASDHLDQAIFLTAAGLLAFGYSLLLPFEFTQRLTLHNWSYLDGRLTAFSVAFGIALGWVVTVQAHAVRQVIRARGNSLGAVGAFFGVLPSLLCCTPVIPTALGTIGLSGVTLAHTSGRIQYFFASKQNAILGASLALVVTAAVWATYRVSHADCFHSEGCAVDAGRGQESHSNWVGGHAVSGPDPVPTVHDPSSDR